MIIKNKTVTLISPHIMKFPNINSYRSLGNEGLVLYNMYRD